MLRTRGACGKSKTHFLLKSSPSLLYFSAISGYCSACCSTYSMMASSDKGFPSSTPAAATRCQLLITPLCSALNANAERATADHSKASGPNSLASKTTCDLFKVSDPPILRLQCTWVAERLCLFVLLSYLVIGATRSREKTGEGGSAER